VFEGERAYGGEIFKLREHTERLFNSARILDFAIPYTVDEIDTVCRELLVLNNLADAYVRPAAWRGSEMMGVSAQTNRINVAIAVWNWPSYFSPEQRLKGIRLDVSEWRRPDPRTGSQHPAVAGGRGRPPTGRRSTQPEGGSVPPDPACRASFPGRVRPVAVPPGIVTHPAG